MGRIGSRMSSSPTSMRSSRDRPQAVSERERGQRQPAGRGGDSSSTMSTDGPQRMSTGAALRLAVVVCFRDEAAHLPTLLDSIAAQTLLPEQLLLVDDGSMDASREIAERFARERRWVRTLALAPRPPSRDRLADAGELRAFLAGVARLEKPWEVVVKLDADLQLNPELFQAAAERFAADPRLGVTGTYLSARGRDGRLRREHRPADHVHGPNKFYRRACFEQIAPLPPILGWDTIDDLRARLHGWRAMSFALDSGESVHLRPMGAHDGRLRAYRRWGECAWGYGSHPLWVALGGVYRMRKRPYVLGGLNYLWGWLVAAARRHPRAESAVRRRARREELAELRERLRLGGRHPCARLRSQAQPPAGAPDAAQAQIVE
jgi:biofilm PGA synthesis N-glycosyltransferase PgaC